MKLCAEKNRSFYDLPHSGNLPHTAIFKKPGGRLEWCYESSGMEICVGLLVHRTPRGRTARRIRICALGSNQLHQPCRGKRWHGGRCDGARRATRKTASLVDPGGKS